MCRKTFSQDDVEKALDMIAAEVAAGDGESVPVGAFTRAADVLKTDRATVHQWWSGKRRTDGEQTTRVNTAIKARERARDLAAQQLASVIEHLGTVTMEADSPQQVAAGVNALRQCVDGDRPLIGADSIRIQIDRALYNPGDPLPPPPTIDADDDD